MFSIPFALSIHKFVTNVGAYVGFGSLVAVALLVLLYFAHARETATLRDRLDEAHARIGGLEQRIVQLMQAQRGRGPVPGAPTPAPGAAVTQPPQSQPGGNLIPSVRRIPNGAAPASGAPAVAPPPPLVAGMNGLAPAAPLGMAGPALASATRTIPVAAAAVSEETMFVAPSTNGVEAKESEDAAGPATAVAAAVAPKPTAIPRPPAPVAAAPAAPPVPPRVQIGGDTPSGSPRRTASGSRPPLLDDLGPASGDRRRLSGRLLPLLIGGAAVIAIIVGLIVIINTGGTTTGTVSHGSGNNATGATVTNHKKHKALAPFVASNFKVSVLNGTAVEGLAGDVGKVLIARGFKQGNVTNAAAQTETSTFVYYVTGKSTALNKVAAQHVATALKLAAGTVRAAGASVLQSCGTSEAGASLGGCKANVIVSVGSNRASLATGSTS
jgi:hypothetical protein